MISMSRTKRVYNTEKYKRRALRHYKAKWDNNQFYLRSMENVSPEEAIERGIPIYASYYAYHKYKEMGMKCRSDFPKEILHRQSRRKNKKQEIEIKKGQ